MPGRRRVAPEPARAARQTVETPTAPGSNSNFTGLPKNGQDIPVTTPVTDPQMQARAVSLSRPCWRTMCCARVETSRRHAAKLKRASRPRRWSTIVLTRTAARAGALLPVRGAAQMRRVTSSPRLCALRLASAYVPFQEPAPC